MDSLSIAAWAICPLGVEQRDDSGDTCESGSGPCRDIGLLGLRGRRALQCSVIELHVAHICACRHAICLA